MLSQSTAALLPKKNPAFGTTLADETRTPDGSAGRGALGNSTDLMFRKRDFDKDGRITLDDLAAKLVLAPEVEQDVTEAYDWYENRRHGLG